MSDFDKSWEITRKWEGGFVDDPDDRGGATNHGITESVARRNGYEGDMKDLSERFARELAFGEYWLRYKVNYVNNQRVANILFDCIFNHGGSGGSRLFQKTINKMKQDKISVDGVIGTNTLSAYDEIADKDYFADKFILQRIDFIANICNKNTNQKRFLLGWLNRARSFI